MIGWHRNDVDVVDGIGSVFRDGKTVDIQTSDLVSGDIVELTTGDSVISRGQVGSSSQVSKNHLYNDHKRPWSWRRLCSWHVHRNLTHRRCVVMKDLTSKGIECELQTAQSESVAKMSSNATMGWLGEFLHLTLDPPLQKQLAQLFLWRLAFAVVFAIIVLRANRFDTHDHVIIYAVTTAIVIMETGTKRILERYVLVHSVSCLEALGGLPRHNTYSIETINEVYNPIIGRVSLSPIQPRDVKEIESSHQKNRLIPLKRLTRKSDSAQQNRWTARDAPTAMAIEVFPYLFGCNCSDVGQFTFDSEVKKMSALFFDTTRQEKHIVTKICDCFTSMDEIKPLDSVTKATSLHNTEALASQDLVLAHKLNSRSRDVVFHDLIGLYDPLRLESKDSVLMCQGAGIVVHMPTRDYPQTPRAIAIDMSILPSPKRMRLLLVDVARITMMTAQEFDALSNDQIDALPQLPLAISSRMIEALHKRNRYNSTTDDGVNDSPSPKRANVDVATESGSDVAKEPSDIILTDDNIISILNVIEEGRRIFDNIQKFVLHVLAANIGFVISLLASLAFKDNTAISVFLSTPVEIIRMLPDTDAFSESGLGFETAVPDILNRLPRDVKFTPTLPQINMSTETPANIYARYGRLRAGSVLGSFIAVIFGFGDGNLGLNCSSACWPSCHDVFHALATVYTAMMWIFLLFSGEHIDFRRSLFFAITVVFFTIFPTPYIPRLNAIVFMHTWIDREWGFVFVAVIAFVVGAEAWKRTKRIYLRRSQGPTSTNGDAVV
ncbi:cation transporting ATPase [Trichoderma sp. SZMC 28012]